MPRPLEVDDLWSIPFVSDPRIAPDGGSVAFVVRTADRGADEDRSTVWLVPANGEGKARELTTGGQDHAPRWSPDGSNLAFVSARDGKPAQLFLLPANGGEARRLTDLPLGVGEPVWSPDGARVAFAAPVHLDGTRDADEDGREAARPMVANRLDDRADGAGLLDDVRQHVFVLTPGEPARQVTVGDFFASSPVWSPDGTSLAFSASVGEDRDVSPTSVVHVVPADGGEARAVTPAEGFLDAAAWSPDGETLLLVGQERLRVGHAALFTVPASGGAPRRLLPDLDRNVMVGESAYPGARPLFVEEGKRVLFCVREGGCTHLLAVSASGGEPETVVGGDRVVAGVSESNGAIAFLAATATSPGEVHVLDDDGERRLTDRFAEALPDVLLVEPARRSFRAPDGRAVEAWILRGEVEGPTPLLLDVHGGPHNAWGPAFDGVHPWHQSLVAKGWTVLLVNPRGSDGYGEEFWSGLLPNGWGRADEGDFLAAVDALVEEGVADPERLAVTGYSYGGYMTCWLTARTDRFAAAVAGGCVSDLLSTVGAADLGWFIGQIELGGNPYDDQARLAELSPIARVASVRTPTLVLHGQEDLRCPVGQAEEWFTALRSRGVPAELVRYPGSSHLFILSGRPSHRVDYGRRVEDWVTRHAGEELPAGGARPVRRRPSGLRARLELLAERHRVPAASVAVLVDGEVVEEAVGVLNAETGVEATTDSVFQAGSIGKTFTATVVMQLVDEGLLDLDAPIVSVLPEFRVADADVTRRVTMRHLLTHTSGIGGDHFPETGRGDDCLERYVETCADLGQGHVLGATMSYCNTGFVVAGRAVERLTGKVWEEALRERLLDPLGLTHTATLPEEAIRYRAAYGHDVEPGEPPRLADVYTLPRATGPAGVSITCTPADLVAFARMHLDGGTGKDGRRILSTSSVRAMQEVEVDVPDPTLGDHWGLGWILWDWSGRRLFGHDGNTIGQSAFLRIVPDESLAVALMTNGGHTRDLYQELMGHLLEELAGIRMPEPPQPLADPPPVEASRYTGVYERVGARWEIVERDGRLTGITTVLGPLAKLVSKTTEEFELHPSGPDTFVIRDEGERTWSPMIFYALPDGSRYVHTGARATPWVGSEVPDA